jgi:membrane fusion protein (multidrug efflux system)
VTVEAATADEVAQLRDEVRRLREEQTKSNGNGSNGAKNGGDEKKEDDKSEKNEEEDKKPHTLRNIAIIAVVIVIAISGFLYWRYSNQFEDTDDATVDGHISGISSRIAGTVVGVYFEENQFVKAGQTLADLDPRDYKVALAQARSQLLEAQAQTQAEQPNVPVTQVSNATNISTAGSDIASAEAGVGAAERDYEAAVAKIAEAEANSAKAQADVNRYRPLVEKDEVPREQFDQVVANAKALAATVEANRASAAAARRQIDQRRAQLSQAQQRAEEVRQNAPRQVAIRQANVVGRQASALTAKAQVDQAELNLSYCKIASPVAGIVAKRSAEVGQRLAPGQEVALIMQTDDLWVTANFKETQLRRMHPQQGVRIHVDSIGADFDGYIESMPASTGAVTSLLPPENATGNFVKVVQRLPVRIRFKKGQTGLDRLRPGMSVEPKVRVE